MEGSEIPECAVQRRGHRSVPANDPFGNVLISITLQLHCGGVAMAPGVHFERR